MSATYQVAPVAIQCLAVFFAISDAPSISGSKEYESSRRKILRIEAEDRRYHPRGPSVCPNDSGRFGGLARPIVHIKQPCGYYAL